MTWWWCMKPWVWPDLFLLDLSPLPVFSGHGSVPPTHRWGPGSPGYKQTEALQVNSASLESLQHLDSVCFPSLRWGHLRMHALCDHALLNSPKHRCILNPLHLLFLPMAPQALSPPHTRPGTTHFSGTGWDLPSSLPLILTFHGTILLTSLLLLCCAGLLSRVWLFATLWTVAWQAPLSMGFSRQEYWSGWPCPPPGDLLRLP